MSGTVKNLGDGFCTRDFLLSGKLGSPEEGESMRSAKLEDGSSILSPDGNEEVEIEVNE